MASNPYVNKVQLADGTSIMDISDTTAVASDVLNSKYFYTASGQKVQGTATGGTPSATHHIIHLEFSDSTDLDLDVYYNDPNFSALITSTEPITYNNKTVDVAELDGTAWYTRPVEHWETVYDAITTLYEDAGDYYFWILSLASITIPDNTTWRITLDDTVYRLISKRANVVGVGNTVVLGNPVYSGGADDGSGVPFCFYNYFNTAWAGDNDLPVTQHSLKIERLVST